MILALLALLFNIHILDIIADEFNHTIIPKINDGNIFSSFPRSLAAESRERIHPELKHAFINHYSKFVWYLHLNPHFCPWLFNRDTKGFIANCPRPIGLERDTKDLTDTYIHKFIIDHQYINRDNLLIVDLTTIADIQRFCPQDTNMSFASCKDDFKYIKILTSEYRSDMQPWLMNRTILIGDGNLTLTMNRMHPQMSLPFAPHLIAVKNSFLNSWGYIFDTERWYFHGGCSDRSMFRPHFEYDLSSQPIIRFDAPILNLIHPYSFAFYHELVEVHAGLFLSLPLLKAMPNTTIFLGEPLMEAKFFPMLEALGIDISNYKIITVNKELKDTIFLAPYVVAPLSLTCHYISRSVLFQMRQLYAKHIPYWHQSITGDVYYILPLLLVNINTMTSQMPLSSTIEAI